MEECTMCCSNTSWYYISYNNQCSDCVSTIALVLGFWKGADMESYGLICTFLCKWQILCKIYKWQPSLWWSITSKDVIKKMLEVNVPILSPHMVMNLGFKNELRYFVSFEFYFILFLWMIMPLSSQLYENQLHCTYWVYIYACSKGLN